MSALNFNGVEFSDLSGEIHTLKVEITKVTADGPGEDGEFGFAVTYVIENDSNEDWDYFDVRAILLDASGRVVEVSHDMVDETIAAGEESALVAWIGGVKGWNFSAGVESALVVIKVVACKKMCVELGDILLPQEERKASSTGSCVVGDSVKVLGGSVSVSEPDHDKECLVEIRFLCQNLTNNWIPALKFLSVLSDKKGNEINSVSEASELMPEGISMIHGFCYAKQKELAGARVDTSISVLLAAAHALSHSTGVDVTRFESSEDDLGDDSHDDFEEESPLHAVMGEIKSSLEIDDGERLICLSCGVAELESEEIRVDISGLSKTIRDGLSNIIHLDPDLDSLTCKKINSSKTNVLL